MADATTLASEIDFCQEVLTNTKNALSREAFAS